MVSTLLRKKQEGNLATQIGFNADVDVTNALLRIALLTYMRTSLGGEAR